MVARLIWPLIIIIGWVSATLNHLSNPYGAFIALVLISIPTIIFTTKIQKGFVLLLILSIFAYIIEGIGLHTGFPYGEFIYSSALGLKVLGVPLLLPFAYVPLVIGARVLTQNTKYPITFGVLALIVLDLILDPINVAAGLWSYPSGAYYGVPLSNYLGWVFSGLIAMTIASRFNHIPQKAVWSVFALLCMWIGAAFAYQLWIPFIIAILCIMYVAYKAPGITIKI